MWGVVLTAQVWGEGWMVLVGQVESAGEGAWMSQWWAGWGWPWLAQAGLHRWVGHQDDNQAARTWRGLRL